MTEKRAGSRERGLHKGRTTVARENKNGVQTIVLTVLEDYRQDRKRKRLITVELTPTQFAQAITGMGERPCLYRLPTVLEELEEEANEQTSEATGKETDSVS